MKKLMLLSLFLTFSMLVNAQSKRDSLMIGKGLSKDLLGNNEIKFNILMAIPRISEFTYERIIQDKHAVGISLFTGLFESTDLRYGAIPYYRFYFGARKASGLFLEGNVPMINTDRNINYGDGRIQKNIAALGLGGAVGFKVLSKAGYTGEIYGGASRLFNTDPVYVFPRIGLTIGKRF